MILSANMGHFIPFSSGPWQAGSLAPPAEFVAASVSHQPWDFLGFYQLYFQEGINRSKNRREQRSCWHPNAFSDEWRNNNNNKNRPWSLCSSSCWHRLFLKPCLFLGLDTWCSGRIIRTRWDTVWVETVLSCVAFLEGDYFERVSSPFIKLN